MERAEAIRTAHERLGKDRDVYDLLVHAQMLCDWVSTGLLPEVATVDYTGS
jgi:hypothetical protein